MWSSRRSKWSHYTGNRPWGVPVRVHRGSSWTSWSRFWRTWETKSRRRARRSSRTSWCAKLKRWSTSRGLRRDKTCCRKCARTVRFRSQSRRRNPMSIARLRRISDGSCRRASRKHTTHSTWWSSSQNRMRKRRWGIRIIRAFNRLLVLRVKETRRPAFSWRAKSNLKIGDSSNKITLIE